MAVVWSCTCRTTPLTTQCCMESHDDYLKWQRECWKQAHDPNYWYSHPQPCRAMQSDTQLQMLLRVLKWSLQTISVNTQAAGTCNNGHLGHNGHFGLCSCESAVCVRIENKLGVKIQIRIKSFQLQQILIIKISNYKWMKRDVHNYILLITILKHIKLLAYDHS